MLCLGIMVTSSGVSFCPVQKPMRIMSREPTQSKPNSSRLSATWQQGASEGGFMGRTNKLVDGCYSFWQGAVFPILASHSPARQCSRPDEADAPSSEALLQAAQAAQQEILVSSTAG